MKKLNVLVLSVIALLSACSSDESLNSETSCPITMDTRSQKIVVQTNSSAWNILHEMIGKGENNLLSPLSLSTCLAILNNGAKGDTDVQIRDFLGLEGFDPTGTNMDFINSRPVSSFQMELNLNRPFLFGLQETSSNTLLFLGMIQNL